jgi:hypothetical protein
MASGTSPKKDKVILLLKQGETSPTGTRSTMSDNQQTAHCVDVSLTARSLSVLSVSLSKGETSVKNPGDDKGCHLELKRSGRQQHCDSTSRSIIA